ncbi:hypothetical protein ACFVFI_10055 [Streptomyces sp. NPDC057705]|uniref:hypothetical protein n=1 Tax=Streptomyces sp. NPDC057705 TaxID=3346222 RepID=UPI00367A516F
MNLNAARLPRMARVAAPVVAALALTMAFAGPAAADPSFVTKSGGAILFAALPGEQNTVKIQSSGSNVIVSDTTSPLTAGPGCAQLNPNAVNCGGGVTRIQAALGNGNDILSNQTSIPSDVDGGAGEDSISGGGGNDRLTDPDGWNSAPGGLTFDGGGGNDTIVSKNGGFDRILCGVGFDIVVADQAALDSLSVTPAHGCEFVIR